MPVLQTTTIPPLLSPTTTGCFMGGILSALSNNVIASGGTTTVTGANTVTASTTGIYTFPAGSTNTAVFSQQGFVLVQYVTSGGSQVVMQLERQSLRRREVIEPRIEAPHVVREKVRERMRKASARMRAMSLLRDQLTDEQRDSLDRHRHFLVQGGRSKAMYRIRDNGGVMANVDLLSVDGKVSHRLCAHANTNEVPHPDQLLAQKLMIEFHEEEFLRIANRHSA